MREAKLEIYNSASKELIDKVILHNNCVNVIALDKYSFGRMNFQFLCREIWQNSIWFWYQPCK